MILIRPLTRFNHGGIVAWHSGVECVLVLDLNFFVLLFCGGDRYSEIFGRDLLHGNIGGKVGRLIHSFIHSFIHSILSS